MATEAVILDEYDHESVQACADATGQTVTEWIADAVRATARRQNAAAYLDWEAKRGRAEFDELDEATTAASLAGMEW